MSAVRGRPGKVDPEKIKEAILKYKDIIKNNITIVSKKDNVWKIIAQELENKMTTNSLYVFTMCNRYNVRDIIFDKMCNDKEFSANENILNNWSESSVNTSSNTNTMENSDTMEKFYIISLLREDFTNLLTEKVYKRQLNNKRKMYYRWRKVLRPGKWQEIITNKFWETTHMKCGFQFKNHYISADTKSGIINGKCC